MIIDLLLVIQQILKAEANLTYDGINFDITCDDTNVNSNLNVNGQVVLMGSDGALQFTNGENSIKIPDNQSSALIIEEANNAYITFDMIMVVKL